MNVQNLNQKTQVKNKAPAPVQITAEQLLRESQNKLGTFKKLAPQKIIDKDEFDDFKFRKRKGFEDALRRNNVKFGVWIRYAQFEESINEFERARSVYERAIAQDHRNETLWMHYLEMEMKNQFVNHARNIFDRVVTLLPRVDQFWYKYAYMEEIMGNIGNARQIFERWMKWEPKPEAWNLYLKLEKRHKQFDKVRQIYKRFVSVHPEPKYWIQWSRFEEDLQEIELARGVYQLAIDSLGKDYASVHIYVAFARFETRMKEYERARVIYKYAIEHFPKEESQTLYQQYNLFEKQFGDKGEIEDVLILKKRDEYQQQLEQSPHQYDTWFDYIRLEESHFIQLQEMNSVHLKKQLDRLRDVYEKAIAQVPPVIEKKYWRRYIYLWLYYAVFEELYAKDMERSRNIYLECLKVLPHKQFTFAKVWIMYAQFEIRNKNLTAARKALGRAIGQCPKPKLYKQYIQMEMDLREFDRCRILYEKYLKFQPASVHTWIQYADLERLLGDWVRARAIYELGIQQTYLDMPELLWKFYIDFEMEQKEYQKVRKLYQRLLDRTSHPKVWSSYAETEFKIGKEEAADQEQLEEAYLRARSLFEDGYKLMKQKDMKSERRLLLENWIQFEAENYQSDFTIENLDEKLKAKMPQQIKKRQRLEDGSFEEFMDYIFPEDELEKQSGQQGLSKLLMKAKKWQQKQHESQEE